MLKKLRPQNSRPNQRVFLRKGKPIKDVWWHFTKAARAAGLEGLRFHDLRHSFVTNARRAGIDRKIIKSISGHVSDKVFDGYNHVQEEDITEAAEKINHYLDETGRRK